MLRIRGLTKQYEAFTLGPLRLDVNAEVMGVIGPSGSGKTTLLSLVAGTETPTDGTVHLNGTALGPQPLDTRGAARVFQKGALFPHLTARENIAYAATASAHPEVLAARLQIRGILDQPARTLSGGEARRVEVARALAADPAVLLLDEPTAGLDTPVRRRLRSHLRALLTALDIPVLYVTHNQEEAALVADRVAVMNKGEIQQIGPPADVFRRPQMPFVARFTGNRNVVPARVETTASGPVLTWGDVRLSLRATDVPPEGDVWLCVRPEEVEIRAEGEASAPNVVEAAIGECIFEGGAYVLTLRFGPDESQSLRAKVLPPTYRALDLDGRRRIYVSLASEALHLIPRPSS